jgi:hypothetical protein
MDRHKLELICRVEYYSATKMSEVVIHATAWKSLEKYVQRRKPDTKG